MPGKSNPFCKRKNDVKRRTVAKSGRKSALRKISPRATLSKSRCLCEASGILFFPCSGASNVGHLADRASRELATEGAGVMYCLAGIGARYPSMIASARDAVRIVCIDGCEVGCAKKILERAGVTITDYIVVSALGIEKKYQPIREKDLSIAKQAIKESLLRD